MYTTAVRPAQPVGNLSYALLFHISNISGAKQMQSAVLHHIRAGKQTGSDNPSIMIVKVYQELKIKQYNLNNCGNLLPWRGSNSCFVYLIAVLTVVPFLLQGLPVKIIPAGAEEC